MKAASPSVAQHRIHARKTLERLIYRAGQAHRIGDICRVIEINSAGICQSSSVRLACSAGLRSIRVIIAPAAFNLFTMCSAIAPMAPVRRITLPERSMWIMVVISVFGALLHDSVLFKCIDCATSLLQSLSHQLLAASLFERFRESLRGRFHRDHANSVDIAKQEITGAHTSRSDFDWDAKVDYLMSGRGILRVRTPTEGGKVHVQNGLGIAHIAVQHGSARAQLASTDAHEFTPEGVARRRSRVDIDLIALQVIQGLEH